MASTIESLARRDFVISREELYRNALLTIAGAAYRGLKVGGDQKDLAGLIGNVASAATADDGTEQQLSDAISDLAVYVEGTWPA